MIAGHFGLAAGVKGAEPRAPLWASMLATAWLDVVFVPLFLASPASAWVTGRSFYIDGGWLL